MPGDNHPLTSTLSLLLPSSNTILSSSSCTGIALVLGVVVLTTAQAVALLIFSSHPPTSPTTSPKGLVPSFSSTSTPNPVVILPELVGRKPPGFLARGIGDINNDS